MERPPGLAKFTPPDVTELVPRERLFAKLDRADKHTAIWVTGPAGAGKTALVASWLAARGHRYLWYSLDEGDADLATFFHYLGLTANPAGELDGSLPTLGPEQLSTLETFARHYFEGLFGHWEAPWMLVLDNFEKVASAEALQTVVEAVLKSMTLGGTLVVLSRVDPGARFARWQASRELYVINWNDLKLTDEDAAAFVTRWGFDAGALQPLVEASGGWAAGLTLMLNAYKDGVPLPPMEPLPAPILADYFAEESFLKAPASHRLFLLRTAFVPRMSATMGAKLSGQADAAAILAELNRQHMFTERCGDHEGGYEYHPLFRSFLLQRAEAEFPPQEFQRRRRDATELLEQDGQIEAAAELYIGGREWDQLTRLIRQHAWALMGQARHETVLSWLDAMPESMIVDSPWLSFRKGVCELLRDPGYGYTWLERAYARFKNEDDPVGLYVTWSAIMESFTLQWSSFVEVDRWIAELEELRQRHPQYPTTDIEVRVMNGGVAVMIRNLDHPVLKQWATRAHELMQILPDPHQRVRLATFAMMYALWRGDLRGARVLRAELEAVATTHRVAPLSAQHCLMWEIIQDVLDANVGRALQATEKVLALADTSGVHVLDVWHYYHAAHASLVAGDVAGAEKHAQSMKETLHANQLMNKVNYQYLRAAILLHRGETQRALELAEDYLPLADTLGSGISSTIFRLQLALTLIACGNHGRAREVLAQALKRAEVIGSTLLRFTGMCALARSLLSTAEHDAGLGALRRAFALGAERDLMVFFPVAAPGMMAHLCSRALDAGIEPDYVRRLIAKLGLMPTSPAIQGWPWPLKLYTLGRFAVERYGEPLRSSGKAQHKPLDLLKALIALGGEDVNTRQLTEALWPDAEGDAAQGAFDATLHRLRRLVDVENAVLLKDGKLSLNTQICWVDAWAFEQACRQEDSAEGTVDMAGIPCDARLIRRLYRGAFMATEDDQPWMLQSRERLRGLFRRRVMAIGQALEHRFQWDQAIELYQHTLDIDPLAEEMYQRLMLAQRELGRLADALDIYRRCRETLSHSLGIRPSATTEAIHRSLRGPT
jgi:DNA-binding SARP family transcriptional activator